MKKSFDLKGLDNFKRKLNFLKKKNWEDFINDILEKICSVGIEYASSLYSGDIQVSKQIVEKGKSAKIIAEGNKIAYLEFGTGEMGRGSYEGQLPDITLRFHSNRLGQDVELNGWTYSYANYLNPEQQMWQGFEAKAQMWKTSQYLKKIIPQIIREVAKSESVS
jgi:hypothetical protein